MAELNEVRSGQRTRHILSTGALALSLLVVASAFLLGVRNPGSDWADGIRLPDWAPPGWLYAPSWLVAYACSGLAAWLVWRRAGIAATWMHLAVFAVLLVADTRWTWWFFETHMPETALLEAAGMTVISGFVMLRFMRASRAAGCLMIPFTLWRSFLTVLNFAVWDYRV